MGPNPHGVKHTKERTYVQKTLGVKPLGMLPVGQFSFANILFSNQEEPWVRQRILSVLPWPCFVTGTLLCPRDVDETDIMLSL